MDKERWTKIALELEPHLRAIGKIVKHNNMDVVCIGAFGDGTVNADFIECKEKRVFSIQIEEEKLLLQEDNRTYQTYIKS